MPAEEAKAVAPREDPIPAQAHAAVHRGVVVPFLNTPLGLWLLSTVLVGAASFGYAQYRDSSEASSARKAEMVRTYEEIAFRVRQMDVALRRAQDGVTQLRNAAQSDIVLDQLIIQAVTDINSVLAVVRAGGLAEIPVDSSVEWVRFRGIPIKPDLLPFRQGYRAKEYSYFSLVDLGARADHLADVRDAAQRKMDLQNKLEVLEGPAYKLLAFEDQRAKPDAPAASRIRDPQQIAAEVDRLLEPISAAWQKVKELPLIGDAEHGPPQ